MIRLDNVSIGFDDRVLFENLNHAFGAGEITVIHKTGVLDGGSTLLKCCAGIVAPLSGSILIGAGNLAQLNSTERFQQLSYCYESEGLVSLFTVYNLSLIHI